MPRKLKSQNKWKNMRRVAKDIAGHTGEAWKPIYKRIKKGVKV